MYKIIQNIIRDKKITVVFQPIFDITNQTIVGYEALSRGPLDSIYYAPDVLFKAATDCGLLSELEILCRDTAIQQFAHLQLEGKLFLNVSPLVLLDKAHPQGETIKLVEKAGLDCRRIVIELSEKYPFPNAETLSLALAKYREFGFDVAIDDLGAGYSGLKMWSQLRPDIVKVDRYFVESCHLDNFKRKFLKAIFELAKSAQAKVVVEGIESFEEYELLRQLGMSYAQGFYLAKPNANPIRHYPQWLEQDSLYLKLNA
ncbi:EAL domain-containing protein [Thalassotalea castellviae]|uniref:EAL domain-containing protein n=1 Tax=Thalassotalea castellviae TaxID=3075612 RepID=A0ABU3A127_9GAMM|nr:EAL domain-containing protein [Thalassotalea sp. W431]MDT0603645.1 EAL domain-containing protein [Thalassotalea sp. W431]